MYAGRQGDMREDQLYKSIRCLIDFIEENIKSRIVLDDLSHYINISKYHLDRIFRSLSGTTLMNYVRNRKLSCSIEELLKTDLRVSDISQEYAFGYDQSYIRAFKSCFGMSPDRFRREKPSILIKDKINVDYIQAIGTDGIIVWHPIYIIPEFWVTGPCYKVYKDEDELYEAGNRLGNDFFYNRRHEIKSVVNPDVYIGLVEADASDWAYTYYSPSVQVSSPGQAPSGMVCKKIPTRKYAMFKYIGLHHGRQITINHLKSTFNYIYGDWFPKSGYRQCGLCHFERIDQRLTREDYCEMEFYIPVEALKT